MITKGTEVSPRVLSRVNCCSFVNWASSGGIEDISLLLRVNLVNDDDSRQMPGGSAVK